MYSTELRSLVSSLEYLVSNGRQVLREGIRLDGSATLLALHVSARITRTFYPLSLLPYTLVPSPPSHQEHKNLSNQEHEKLRLCSATRKAACADLYGWFVGREKYCIMVYKPAYKPAYAYNGSRTLPWMLKEYKC